jgi:hypothetical protein
MHFARHAHSATLLANGMVLIAGGYTASGATNTAELFDPVSETFTLLSPNSMSSPRFYHTATLLPSGKVLFTGGSTGTGFSNTGELFDPASQTFTALSNTMNMSRYWHTAVQLQSGKVLVVGGYTDAGTGLPFDITSTAELFDPASETFTLVSSTMSNGRANGNTVTQLTNGEVLIAAGLDGNTLVAETANSSADLFDEGLGFSDARRPVISQITGSLNQNDSVSLAGSGFRGDSEGASSGTNSSATNYPLLQLTRIDNEQSFFVFSNLTTNWSDSSFVSRPLGGTGTVPAGVYRATVFTNAIPSLQKIVTIAATPSPVSLTSVVSRKTHGSAGTYDVDLTNGSGIECRSGGTNGDYTIVFSFANPLTSIDSSSVTSGTGSVASSTIDSSDAHNYVVNLTGVANAQTITVSLTNVTDSVDNFSPAAAGSMKVLLGDTNADGFVNSADIGQTKSQSGQPVTSSNFREDMNEDGFINSADIGLVKSKSGTALP